MKKLLFVCSRNRWRSPTAEAVFAGIDGYEVSSAGTSKDAENPIDADALQWADRIYFMESGHLKLIRAKFSSMLIGKEIFVLNIKDKYKYMDLELIELLKSKIKLH